MVKKRAYGKKTFSLFIKIIVICGAIIVQPASAAQFQPPQTGREKLNFDLDRKYRKGDQPGHFITYNNVGSNSATIKIETWVKNVTGTVASGKLVTSVVDPVSGQLLQSDEATFTAGNNEVVHSTQSINVSGIKLWAQWSPNLYKVYTAVYNGNTPVDHYTTRIGIREITWNKNSGASINDTIGLNRTDQWVFLGHACPNNQQKRDAAVLREWGCNFVRCTVCST